MANKTPTTIAALAVAVTCMGILTAAAPGAQAVQQSTRFVAIGGTDTTDCTATASPCSTINYAIGQAAAGDIAPVGAGTFVEAVVIN